MKIVILNSVLIEGKHTEVNSIVEINDKDAKYLINSKFAKEFDETSKEEIKKEEIKKEEIKKEEIKKEEIKKEEIKKEENKEKVKIKK